MHKVMEKDAQALNSGCDPESVAPAESLMSAAARVTEDVEIARRAEEEAIAAAASGPDVLGPPFGGRGSGVFISALAYGGNRTTVSPIWRDERLAFRRQSRQSKPSFV